MEKVKLYYIVGPSNHAVSGYWLYDHLLSDGYDIQTYYLRKNDKENYLKVKSPFRLLLIICRLLFSAKKQDKILVYDNDTTGIYIGLAISILRPSLIVMKINCMANSKERLYSPLKRIFVRRAYKHIYTTVNNQTIADIFSNFLDLPSSHFIPVPDSLANLGEEISKISDFEDKNYIFMGGASNRDFSLFVEVAKQLPQYKFIAVTFEKYKHIFLDAPTNVEVKYGIPVEQFLQILANASLLFIPLINNMQGGQLVIFQGALSQKPILTTDTVAIHTYFTDSSISLIPMGDLDSAVEKVNSLMEDEERRKLLGQAAYNQILKFTPKKIYNEYRTKLLVIG